MPLLYRAYTDQSQGYHSESLVAPGAARDPVASYKPSVPHEQLAQKLRDALNWEKTSGNEFGFWTSSILFATQTAIYRTQKKETNGKIVCINTETARTPDGGPAIFEHVPKLKQRLGVDLRNKDGSIQTHDEVWITIYCFVPGRDTRIAKFQDMADQGLYVMYPALEGSWRSHRPRLNLIVQDMRRFHFQYERKLSDSFITLAAKVASSFAPLSSVSSADKVHPYVLVCLLGLAKRRPQDPALLEWIDQHMVIETDKTSSGMQGGEPFLPEIQQMIELCELFANKKVRDSVLSRSASNQERSREWQSWRAWRINNKHDRYAARETDSSPHSQVERSRLADAGWYDRRGVDNISRTPDRLSDLSLLRGMRSNSDRYQKRSQREWLPRFEYEQLLATRHGTREVGKQNCNPTRDRKRHRDDNEAQVIGQTQEEVNRLAKRPRRNRPDRPSRY